MDSKKDRSKDKFNDKNGKNDKGDEDMTTQTLTNKTYRKLNLSADKIGEISVTPKIKDGKLLFNRKNKDHRYIVEDD